MEERTWNNLPDHIVNSILRYLPLGERYHAALTCKDWLYNFECPYQWTRFNFRFNEPSHGRFLKALDRYGAYFRHVDIQLDQSVAGNRDNACKVFRGLSALEERKLRGLRVAFTGENPYFYAGQELIDALMTLFGPGPGTGSGSGPSPPPVDVPLTSLTSVDLSGLTVAYDDKLFNQLSEHHRQLEMLDIQNNVLVCKVSALCMLRLVQRCRKLRDLRLFHCSVSDDLLVAFTEEQRAPLRHLAMKCRREEKYIKDTSSATWRALVAKLPDLRVTLTFDHTCPLHKVNEVMKPEIPVRDLRLETFTYIYDEVRQAALYYKGTLEKLVLQTPLSRNSPELNSALLTLATDCTKLASLHVFCVLDKDTVEAILKLHPGMCDRQTYTLKYEAEPHPWIAGNDCPP